MLKSTFGNKIVLKRSSRNRSDGLLSVHYYVRVLEEESIGLSGFLD